MAAMKHAIGGLSHQIAEAASDIGAANSWTPRRARPSNGTIRSRVTKWRKTNTSQSSRRRSKRSLHGDKTLTVSAFVDLAGVDDLYFDKPYYLGPSDRSADETFALVREGMRAAKAAAVAEAVLFRRARTVLRRPFGRGLAASALNYDYEVRSAAEAFSGVSAKATTGEVLDLAVHIIKTKQGAFDPREFHDRYEDALTELMKLKLEGKTIPKRAPAQAEATISLMQALRDSAVTSGHSQPSSKTAAKKKSAPENAKPAAPRRKAG
jgi:DNA end-binding protein Ku